jgi:hypothetical protein
VAEVVLFGHVGAVGACGFAQAFVGVQHLRAAGLGPFPLTISVTVSSATVMRSRVGVLSWGGQLSKAFRN